MAQLKALLWDVDGTLADTERDGHRVAFNKAFQEAGLQWHWDEALYGELLTVTGGKERIRFFLTHYAPDFVAPADLNVFIAQLHQRKTYFYLRMLQAGDIPLRSGVKRLLQQARTVGLRLAIVTTTTPDNVTYLLQSTLGEASLGWFDCIAAGDIVAKKKPAADIYHYALQQLQLEPADCLALEDSDNGLRAALAAGVRTVVTVNAYTAQQDFQGACLVVDQLGEPDDVCHVLSGPSLSPDYVTVELLQQLHAA